MVIVDEGYASQKPNAHPGCEVRFPEAEWSSWMRGTLPRSRMLILDMGMPLGKRPRRWRTNLPLCPALASETMSPGHDERGHGFSVACQCSITPPSRSRKTNCPVAPWPGQRPPQAARGAGAFQAVDRATQRVARLGQDPGVHRARQTVVCGPNPKPEGRGPNRRGRVTSIQ